MKVSYWALSLETTCDCIVCLGVNHKEWFSSRKPCRVPGSDIADRRNGSRHRFQIEASDFRIDGRNGYRCGEVGCKATAANMLDLERHYTVKHCKKPQKFPCPLLWCKYSGDNGFRRKDKLTSHYKNMHNGKALPDKPFRIIKPAISKDSGSGSGSRGDAVHTTASSSPK